MCIDSVYNFTVVPKYESNCTLVHIFLNLLLQLIQHWLKAMVFCLFSPDSLCYAAVCRHE
jgi:hypothetical protein